MKKAILIFTAILLISEGSYCQWYQRQYGVNNLNLLTIEQLNEALTKSKTGLVFGAVLAIPATVGIISGLILMQAPFPESMGKSFAGIAYIILSIPLEILGVTLLGVYSSRLKSIKGTLKSTEMKIGFINYPAGKVIAGSVTDFSPGFSITFRF